MTFFFFPVRPLQLFFMPCLYVDEPEAQSRRCCSATMIRMPVNCGFDCASLSQNSSWLPARLGRMNGSLVVQFLELSRREEAFVGFLALILLV